MKLPMEDFLDNFKHTVDTLREQHYKIIAVGDLNLKLFSEEEGENNDENLAQTSPGHHSVSPHPSHNGLPLKQALAKLEQLRAFDMDMKIIIEEAVITPGPDVDNEKDLNVVRSIFDNI